MAGHLVPATVAIGDDGRIVDVEVGPPGRLGVGPSATVDDWGDDAVLPGLVDVHVHVNEPGRTEWEGFATATAAAAAGGITTIVDMPLNARPATTSMAGLAAKTAALGGAGDALQVDVGLWGGVVSGNLDQLVPLWAAGVLGFKAFLVPSGVDEFPAVGRAELLPAMKVLAALGAPLLAHAELPARLAEPTARFRELPLVNRRRHRAWQASRPPAAEVAAIELLVDLCRQTGCRVHVVHVAAADALPILAAARAEGLAITAETCPHYLTFASDEVPDGGTLWKCAPPIRDGTDREALWQALRDGKLDFVASDHSPAPPALKALDTGDFAAAWGGIASLELLLPAVWTGARYRGVDLPAVANWLSAAPAGLAGLAAHKGAIAVGHDADLVVFDPDAEVTVDAGRLHQRHALTPYAGYPLRGRVRATYLRGDRVAPAKAFAADDAGGAVSSGRGHHLVRPGVLGGATRA